MRSATLPPIRVAPELRAQVEAVLREGESLSQFIEVAVAEAAAWRQVQAEFVGRGEAAIAQWRQQGGGVSAGEGLASLQARLDVARSAALGVQTSASATATDRPARQAAAGPRLRPGR